MNWPSNDTLLTKELPHLRLVTILQSSHPLDTNGDSSRHTARSQAPLSCPEMFMGRIVNHPYYFTLSTPSQPLPYQTTEHHQASWSRTLRDPLASRQALGPKSGENDVRCPYSTATNWCGHTGSIESDGGCGTFHRFRFRS